MRILIVVIGVVCLAIAMGSSTAARGQVAAADPTFVQKGQEVYANYCVGCHLASGEGNPPAIAALAGNSALADDGRVVRSVRDGRGTMPAFKRLDAAELAAVLTYIRSAWGNAFGGVDPARVTMTISELEGAAAATVTGAATPGPGWYTAEQAARGKGLYAEHCARCHGANFVPDDFATGLTGAAFDWRWKGRTVYDFVETIRSTMPPAEGGTLGPRTTRDIAAYVLQANGFPAGSKELPLERETLEQLKLTR